MAVQTFTILNKANHAPGTYSFPATPMPAGMTHVRLYIDSSQAGTLQYSDPATHIDIYWATSIDGGQTYAEDGATTEGGYRNRAGVPTDPAVDVNFAIPPDHAQGRVVVSGGTVRFGVLADVTTG